MNDLVLPIVLAVIGSSGLWNIINRYLDRQSADKRLLLCLGKEKLCCLCQKAIDDGFITQSDYEDVCALYEPYVEMGGNGRGKHLKELVDKLPIKED